MTLPLADAPAVISDSIAITLRAHAMSLSPELLSELGRNAAQALLAIDELLMQPAPSDLMAVGQTLRALAATGKAPPGAAEMFTRVGEWLRDLSGVTGKKAA